MKKQFDTSAMVSLCTECQFSLIQLPAHYGFFAMRFIRQANATTTLSAAMQQRSILCRNLLTANCRIVSLGRSVDCLFNSFDKLGRAQRRYIE